MGLSKTIKLRISVVIFSAVLVSLMMFPRFYGFVLERQEEGVGGVLIGDKEFGIRTFSRNTVRWHDNDVLISLNPRWGFNPGDEFSSAVVYGASQWGQVNAEEVEIKDSHLPLGLGVGGSQMVFNFQYEASERRNDRHDGKNRVSFIYEPSDGTCAYTRTRIKQSTGEIRDADITFYVDCFDKDDEDFRTFISTKQAEYLATNSFSRFPKDLWPELPRFWGLLFLNKSAIHEFGHFLGLKHDNRGFQIMATTPKVLATSLARLSGFDVGGARALYPAPEQELNLALSNFIVKNYENRPNPNLDPSLFVTRTDEYQRLVTPGHYPLPSGERYFVSSPTGSGEIGRQERRLFFKVAPGIRGDYLISVENLGNVPVGLGEHRVLVGFYLSDDRSLSVNEDHFLGTLMFTSIGEDGNPIESFGSLFPNSQGQGNFPFEIPNIPEGVYSLFAKIDPFDNFAESNEADNIVEYPVLIVVDQNLPSGAPELQVIYESEISVGQEVTIEYKFPKNARLDLFAEVQDSDAEFEEVPWQGLPSFIYPNVTIESQSDNRFFTLRASGFVEEDELDGRRKKTKRILARATYLEVPGATLEIAEEILEFEISRAD